jgi:hypothetical protein
MQQRLRRATVKCAALWRIENMKNAIIALAIIAMFDQQAHATTLPANVNNNTNAQNQGQAQGQLQGQTQAAIGVGIAGVKSNISNDVRNRATSSANNLGNSLTVNEAPIPANTTQTIHNSDYTVKNVPNVLTGSVYPTAPCMGGSQVGAGWAGAGLSIGTSWESDECMIGETARGFEQAGYREDAMAVRCQGKYAAVAPSCKALLNK